MIRQLQKGHHMEWQDGTAAIREAVEARNAARECGACSDGGRMCGTAQSTEPAEIPAEWILQGEAELRRERDEPQPLGASVLAERPEMPAAELLLVDALEVIRQRRRTYAGPKKHFARTVGAINALFSHKLREPLTMSDWAQFMILDKLARNQGEQKTADTPIDLAGYAACLAECEAPE